MHVVESFLCIILPLKVDKGEASRESIRRNIRSSYFLLCGRVLDDLTTSDGPEDTELSPQVFLSGLEVELPDIKYAFYKKTLRDTHILLSAFSPPSEWLLRLLLLDSYLFLSSAPRCLCSRSLWLSLERERRGYLTLSERSRDLRSRRSLLWRDSRLSDFCLELPLSCDEFLPLLTSLSSAWLSCGLLSSLYENKNHLCLPSFSDS